MDVVLAPMYSANLWNKPDPSFGLEYENLILYYILI